MKKPFLSLLTILLIALTIIKIDSKDAFWKIDFVIKADINGYYAYLPAVIIHHDPKLDFLHDANTPNYGKYYHVTGPENSLLIKYTCGVAILHSPFFLIAHALAPLFNEPQDGYSDIYEIALLISSAFYLLLGFWFLRKTLLLYFADWVVALSLFTIFFATNLFEYATSEAGMSHAYSFGLFSIFIWHVIKWHKSNAMVTAVVLGLTLGLITLLRPTNILIVLLFIFYDVTNLASFISKIKLLFTNYLQLILLALFAFIALSPQLIYWKIVTHQWVCYSYNNEGFFFTQPKIIDGLFSYRNGWLLYSPILILALAGMLFLKKYAKAFALALPVLMIISTYVILSWWCWWYVGFGNRAFVEFSALLALPLCAFITFVYQKLKLNLLLLIIVIGAASYLNTFQAWQYKVGLMHWDSMNKRAYWALFLKDEKPPGFDYLLTPPNYDKAVSQREN